MGLRRAPSFANRAARPSLRPGVGSNPRRRPRPPRNAGVHNARPRHSSERRGWAMHAHPQPARRRPGIGGPRPWRRGAGISRRALRRARRPPSRPLPLRLPRATPPAHRPAEFGRNAMLDRPHPTPEAPTTDPFALAKALSGLTSSAARYVPARGRQELRRGEPRDGRGGGDAPPRATRPTWTPPCRTPPRRRRRGPRCRRASAARWCTQCAAAAAGARRGARPADRARDRQGAAHREPRRGRVVADVLRVLRRPRRRS